MYIMGLQRKLGLEQEAKRKLQAENAHLTREVQSFGHLWTVAALTKERLQTLTVSTAEGWVMACSSRPAAHSATCQRRRHTTS
jgi:hypothetical protein